MAKLISQGKTTNLEEEGLEYPEEHPDEMQELLREVFESSDENGGSLGEMGDS